MLLAGNTAVWIPVQRPSIQSNSVYSCCRFTENYKHICILFMLHNSIVWLMGNYLHLQYTMEPIEFQSEATISPRERSQKVRASAAHTTYTVCHSKSLPVFIAGHGRRDLNWSSPMKGQLLGERLLWASRTSAVGLCWQMRRLAWEQSGGHPAGRLQTSTCWRSSRGPNRANSTHHAERRVKATACRVGLQRSFAVRLKTSQVQLSCQQLSWNRHPSRRAGDPTPF